MAWVVPLVRPLAHEASQHSRILGTGGHEKLALCFWIADFVPSRRATAGRRSGLKGFLFRPFLPRVGNALVNRLAPSEAFARPVPVRNRGLAQLPAQQQNLAFDLAG